MQTTVQTYKKRQVELWRFRLLEEIKNSKGCYFVTISYRRSKSPTTSMGLKTLCKTDVQKYLKRLRRYLPAGQNIKYYCYAHYEKKTALPQYYILFFNIKKSQLFKHWPEVKLKFDRVDDLSINRLFQSDQQNNHKRKTVLPFRLISHGLGEKYLPKVVDKIKLEGLTVLGEFHRYYKKKLIL